MALRLIHGWETGNTGTFDTTWLVGGVAASSSGPRTGTYHLRIAPAGAPANIRYGTPNAVGQMVSMSPVISTIHFTFWLRIATDPTALSILFSIGASTTSGTSTSVRLELTTSRTLQIASTGGSGTTSSETTALSAGTYYHRVDMSLTEGGGACELRLDSAAPVTCVSNTADFAWYFLGGSSDATLVQDVDDLWVSDTSICPDNGGVRIIVPSGDSATNTHWLASAGSKWDCLEERPGATTEYISSQTTAGTRVYSATHASFSSLGYSGRISAVAVWALVGEAASATTLGAIGIRSGSTNFPLTEADVGNTSAVWWIDVLQNDPNTSLPWTVAALDAAEPLVQRSTSDTSDIRCYVLQMQVWIAPAFKKKYHRSLKVWNRVY